MMLEWGKCVIFATLLIAFTLIGMATMATMTTDSGYVKANRYSSCMEALLETTSDKNDIITFEQMESVCKHYLD